MIILITGKPEDHQIEPHAWIKMVQGLVSLVYICGILPNTIVEFDELLNCFMSPKSRKICTLDDHLNSIHIAALWSGRHTHITESWNNYKGLPQNYATWETVLKQNGYRTKIYGKTDYHSGHHSLR